MPAKGQDIMSTSIFLAKLIGPILLAIGVGMLLNGKVYRGLAREFLHSQALIYLSGVLAMLGGLAIILSHNVWTADWRVLVTLLGWLAAVGGVVRIVLPQQVEGMGLALYRHPPTLVISAAVTLAIGALLVFFGYVR